MSLGAGERPVMVRNCSRQFRTLAPSLEVRWLGRERKEQIHIGKKLVAANRRLIAILRIDVTHPEIGGLVDG